MAILVPVVSNSGLSLKTILEFVIGLSTPVVSSLPVAAVALAAIPFYLVGGWSWGSISLSSFL